MFITIETLKKADVCEQGIRYMERFYPNGAEMIDIIRDRHISKDFLHWGREWLTVNEEELKAYCEVCEIINSEGFWYSLKVKNSKYVVDSKEVNNSKSIFESDFINNSFDVFHSSFVDDSSQIFYSEMIDNCQKILVSKNITESNNICHSTMVARSQSIVDSFNVFDSSEINRSTNVSNSHFCSNCKDIKFCMFCYSLENAEYHIFNKPVEKSHYEMFVKQYAKYLTEQLEFVKDWPKEMLVDSYVTLTRKFDNWYHPISEKFWKWARTLPGYDSMLLYNITMIPEILID